jgi:hypothetical protein
VGMRLAVHVFCEWMSAGYMRLSRKVGPSNSLPANHRWPVLEGSWQFGIGQTVCCLLESLAL